MTKNHLTDIDLLRQELAEYSKRSFHRGLTGGTGGNLSARILGTDTVLITPSGISLEDVEPEECIIVNLGGEVVDCRADLEPSKETSFHVEVYKMRPDIHALAHLHPPYATAFSNKVSSLPLVTVQARIKLVNVPSVRSAMPGSDDLCESVCSGLERFPDVRAFLMKEHGILALGRDIKNAYHLADLLEDTARMAFIEAKIK